MSKLRKVRAVPVKQGFFFNDRPIEVGDIVERQSVSGLATCRVVLFCDGAYQHFNTVRILPAHAPRYLSRNYVLFMAEGEPQMTNSPNLMRSGELLPHLRLVRHLKPGDLGYDDIT